MTTSRPVIIVVIPIFAFGRKNRVFQTLARQATMSAKYSQCYRINQSNTTKRSHKSTISKDGTIVEDQTSTLTQ